MLSYDFFRYVRHSESLYLIVSIVCVVLGLTVFMPVLFPIWIAAMMSYLLHYLVGYLSQWMSRKAAHLISFLGFMSITIFSCFTAIPLMIRQAEMFYQSLPTVIEKMNVNLVQATPHDEFSHLLGEGLNHIIQAFQSQEFMQKALEATVHMIPSAVHAVVYCVIIPVMVFFMTRDSVEIMATIRAFYPQHAPHLERIGVGVLQQIDYYVRGKIVHMVILGLGGYLLFRLIGLNYAFLLSIPLAISVFIPFVGATLATIPILLTGYAQFGFSWEFVQLLAILFGYELFEANILVPMIFSHANNMSPLTILIAIVVFGGFFGVLGLFLAIPIAAILKVIWHSWPIEEKGSC